jgi:phospholipid/cholesterol/gamma-HCH transport system substrate-binding protein
MVLIRRLNIDPESPNFVIADTEVRSNAPIYTDTRAALEIQGLTGSAYIELQGGTPSNRHHPSNRQLIDGGQSSPVIDADPSGVTNLLATADEILTRANRVIGEVESFVKDARSPLTETLKNTETFSAALSEQCRRYRRVPQKRVGAFGHGAIAFSQTREHARIGRTAD